MPSEPARGTEHTRLNFPCTRSSLVTQRARPAAVFESRPGSLLAAAFESRCGVLLEAFFESRRGVLLKAVFEWQLGVLLAVFLGLGFGALPQFDAPDLATHGLGQRVDEFDDARILVGNSRRSSLCLGLGFTRHRIRCSFEKPLLS